MSKIFPNVEHFVIEAENILEQRVNLKQFAYIKTLQIIVSASNEYSGRIDTEETDPEFKFELQMENQ